MQKRWFGFLGIALFTVAVVTVNRYYVEPLLLTETHTDSLTQTVIDVKEPKVLYGMVVDNYKVVEDKVKRNQSLGKILEEYNVPANIIHQVSQLSSTIFDVHKIAPDKKYTLPCDQDSSKTAKVLVYDMVTV